MTLADELRGIRPRVTCIPKRVELEPPEHANSFLPDLPRRQALREWIKTAGRFTYHDAMDAVVIDKGHATQYLTDFHRSGLIRKVGTMPSMGGRKAAIYEAAPEPTTKAEKANRKYFGA